MGLNEENWMSEGVKTSSVAGKLEKGRGRGNEGCHEFFGPVHRSLSRLTPASSG